MNQNSLSELRKNSIITPISKTLLKYNILSQKIDRELTEESGTSYLLK